MERQNDSYFTEDYLLSMNLSYQQINYINSLPLDEHLCMVNEYRKPHPPEPYCEPIWDTVKCWPATPGNTTATLFCPFVENSTVLVSRTCLPDGTWAGNKTDYNQCIALIPQSENEGETQLAQIVRDVYFIGCFISLIFLSITLFVFCYFRSLQCTRISIHKNLVVSFIVRFVLVIILFEPLVTKRKNTYRDVDWLCKTFTALSLYAMTANFFWMFVEGLFLHNRLVISVFSNESPFLLFYFIGWGIPGLLTISWGILMDIFHRTDCWTEYSKSPLLYIIIAPVILVLVVNVIFLVNIIRVLVTKLRANYTVETAQIRKAAKATVILLPLLGLTNLLFFFKPEDKGSIQDAYRITNAVLHSLQGTMVAVLYCFLNGEVRSVLKKKWYRYKITRMMSSRARRRSSRTSSFYLSQTESNLYHLDQSLVQ